MNKIKILIFFGLFFIVCNSYAQSNWTFVKETYLNGNISGTITQGYVFKVSSNEFYVVDERVRQRVRVRNPKVRIFQRGTDFKLIIENFGEPVICKKLSSVLETRINGVFKGWDGETIFKLQNGQIWQQAFFAYKYHYAYSPVVLIYEYRGSYLMKVEGVDETIAVNLITNSSSNSSNDIIESRIDGEFKGWDGETIFKLQNGQIWQQAFYAYHYHYAFSPKVTIYRTSGGYEMQVDGVTNRIRVKRLR